MPSPYRLHCFAQSGNCYKVALYLNCAGVPWEPVFVDFLKGATREPKWRAAWNEMGEAPVLEAGAKKLTQSGAILTFLAEKHGRFAPATADEKYEVLRWMLFDNHKFTSYFGTYRFLKSFAPQAPDPAVLAFLKARIDAAFAIVDRHLAEQPFMIGREPTIADLSLAGYLFYPVAESGYDLATSHPAIFAWTGRIKALSGWKDPYDLLPGGRIPPRA